MKKLINPRRSGWFPTGETGRAEPYDRPAAKACAETADCGGPRASNREMLIKE
jgi:hypothetical protein